MDGETSVTTDRIAEFLKELTPEMCPIKGCVFRQGIDIPFTAKVVALAFALWDTQTFHLADLAQALTKMYGRDEVNYSGKILAGVSMSYFLREGTQKNARNQPFRVGPEGIKYLRSKTEASGMDRNPLTSLELDLVAPASQDIARARVAPSAPPPQPVAEQKWVQAGPAPSPPPPAREAQPEPVQPRAESNRQAVMLIERANELRRQAEQILGNIPESRSTAYAAFSVCFSTLNVCLRTLAIALSDKPETVATAAVSVCIESLDDTMKALIAALADYKRP